MNKVYEEVRNIEKELIEIRRYLHMNPELGLEETNTSKFIRNFLDNEGIEYSIYSKTGVVGIIRGSLIDNGKSIGLRADIDALPIKDMKKCEYSSKIEGCMHACGHDAHTTILLGAARVLNNNRDKFGGTIYLIFEPAEETVGGSKLMIEEGLLDNIKIDVMAGLHVDETLDCGKIRVSNNLVNAASNPFKVKIIGRGGHGAYPSRTIDPVVVTSNIISSLQNIISREVSPVNSALISIGTIHGGTAQNVIPEIVEFSGIIRTVTSEDREMVTRRFRDVVEGISTSFNCESEIYIEESYPCLNNNSSVANILKSVAEDIIGETNVVLQESPKMGVESFAYFAEKIPSVFYFLGCRNEEKNIIYSAHNPMFDVDEGCLSIGVVIQCQMALEYLK